MELQTFTFEFSTDAGKERGELKDAFIGKSLDALRTPALVIDRTIFAQNCAKMHRNALNWGARFRVHLKTHKTIEGAELELKSTEDVTHAVIVSTVKEAAILIPLARAGTIKDVLYGLPIACNKLEDLSQLRERLEEAGCDLRIIVDHPAQVRFLETFEQSRASPHRWYVFLKIDQGARRAGITVDSPFIHTLIHTLLKSPAVSLYGFYGHAGDSYSSTSPAQAETFLSGEVEAVNTAAGIACSLLAQPGNELLAEKYSAEKFVLSVGSTPTAHATAEAKSLLASTLNGVLEIHAGNYPMLDLQQLHTGLITKEDISHRMITTVVSYYPGRGSDGGDEALCDAGAIAMSKDRGPIEGFGDVIGKPWRLGRISQEHGVLTRTSPANPSPDVSDESEMGRGDGGERLEIGSRVEVVGQHACLIAAAAPWIYVVEGGGRTVVDIWQTWKGW